MTQPNKPWKIVAIDPGTSNCGLSVIAWKSPKSWKIEHCSMVRNTVKDLKAGTDVRKNLIAWSTELKPHIADADFVVCERFEARSVTRKTTGEAVGLMIGVLYPMHKSVTLVPARIWKGAVTRNFDLKMAYRTCSLPPHVLDSALIGLWHAHILDGLKPFSTWNVRDLGKLVGLLRSRYVLNTDRKEHKERKIKRLKEFVGDLKSSFKNRGE